MVKGSLAQEEMLNFVMDDHMDWRKYFHPEDKPVGEDKGRFSWLVVTEGHGA